MVYTWYIPTIYLVGVPDVRHDIMESNLWYHTSESMISVTYHIIGPWYHDQYHMQNHIMIWYHGIKTMISYFSIRVYDIISFLDFYDIRVSHGSNLWYHRSTISYMITSMIWLMISPMIAQSIPRLTQFCEQMISIWAYPTWIAQASRASSWQRRGVELDVGKEQKAADWSLEVLDGVCPTPGPAMAPSPRARSVMTVTPDRCRPAPARWSQHHPRRLTAQGPCLLPASKPQRRRGLSRGRGRPLWQRLKCQARATPAPEPSSGLASQVKLELLVAGLLQTFEGCCELVSANSGNPAVVGPEVRSYRKKDSHVQWKELGSILGNNSLTYPPKWCEPRSPCAARWFLFTLLYNTKSIASRFAI